MSWRDHMDGEDPCAIDGCAIVGVTMLLPIRLCRKDAARLVGGQWRLKVTLEPEPVRAPVSAVPPVFEGDAL